MNTNERLPVDDGLDSSSALGGASKWRFVFAGFLVVLGAILFSTKAIFVKMALPYGVGPVGLLSLRMLFSLPAYLVILAVCLLAAGDRREKLQQVRREWPKIVALGVVGYYLASYFDFVGLSFIDASLERVILYLYPTMVLLIAAVWFKKTITHDQVVAIVLCYVGIFVAIRFGKPFEDQSNLMAGSGLIFLSALAYAIYLVGSGQLIPRIGTWTFTSCAMLVSVACVVVHQMFSGGPLVGNYHQDVYVYAISMAILSTVIPSFLISAGIKEIGASYAAIFGGIGPVSTILLASIFLGEVLSTAQIAGTGLVIMGVVYIALTKKV